MRVCRLAVILTLVLLLMPLTIGAQPVAGIPRIGILSPGPSAAASASPFNAFREALRELGYVEGKNIYVMHRFLNDNQRIQRLGGPTAPDPEREAANGPCGKEAEP